VQVTNATPNAIELRILLTGANTAVIPICAPKSARNSLAFCSASVRRPCRASGKK